MSAFDEQPDGDPHAECAAEIHRLQAVNADLLTVLREALEYAEDREDILDGSDGTPQANDEMRLADRLRAAIAKAGAA